MRAWCRPSEGAFTLDDYVAYIEEFIRHIGAENLHVISVCQPTVPVLAAVSLMAARGEATPRSLVMMGGPIDTRESPTQVNDLATKKPLSWFENNVIHTVPANYPGPGPPRVSGLPAARRLHRDESRAPLRMSHWDFYQDLVKGDLEDAESHRRFYDEYNAVLDMPAEYYLDTIRIVFQEHLLPRGEWDVAGERVDPAAITQHRAADHRRRTRRHLRPGPDPRRARPVHRHPEADDQQHLDRRGRRPLRHLQRPPLAHAGVSAGARLHRPLRGVSPAPSGAIDAMR